jgi:mannose-6-phosphate isomerase-like protein (cupin superfamily)
MRIWGNSGGCDVMTESQLAKKLTLFANHWTTGDSGPSRGSTECDIMIVKVKGEFIRHKHEDTDDFFLVLKEKFQTRLRDRVVTLETGANAHNACGG